MVRKLMFVLAFCGFGIGAVYGGAHTWDVNEVFSNADGTIQFIELREAAGTPGEVGLGNKNVSSLMTGNVYTIPANVVGPTSNRHYLIATQAFADLPGAPTPDRILPAGLVPFFDIDGDSVTYHVYDTFMFGPVPIDGIMSMNDGNIVAANSPTNYAGQTGSVDAGGPGIAGDFDGDGDVDLGDFATFGQCFGGSFNPPAASCPAGVDADLDGDGDVDLGDFALFSQNFTGSL